MKHSDARAAYSSPLTGITRHDIERDVSREAIKNSPMAGHMLSDADMQASLDAMLVNWNGSDDVYVFGYGSLIWNPCMEHSGRIAGTVRGYHRRFCLWSNVYRGTPEKPGLVLGLDLGGAVRGMLFRLSAKIARKELELLWRREMFGGSYVARWLKAKTEEGEVNAIGFVINHQSKSYAARLSDDEVVEKLATCCGRYGSGADYLAQTAASLRAAGLDDPHLDRLCDLLTARQFAASAD
jgi:glutathione-specific gamma-glutamylcyclotransferase